MNAATIHKVIQCIPIHFDAYFVRTKQFVQFSHCDDSYSEYLSNLSDFRKTGELHKLSHTF